MSERRWGDNCASGYIKVLDWLPALLVFIDFSDLQNASCIVTMVYYSALRSLHSCMTSRFHQN